MLEDLHIGVHVVSGDGKRVGKLTRIVIERSGAQVTHLVIDPGLVASGNALAPGGWDRPRERVIPVTLVAGTSDDELRLRCNANEFEQMPLFENKDYASAELENIEGGLPVWQSRFAAGEVLNYVASGFGFGGAPYLAPAEITLNEPAGAANIAENTPVWRLTPHEEIGEVDRVLADPQTQRASGLVVRRHGVFGQRVIVPIRAIHDVEDGVVHVSLSDDELDALERFHETQ